jgi:hypothetical protein
MTHPIDLSELRLQMAVRLAVAPKRLFKVLAANGTPTDHDKARDELVALLTAGWERFDLTGTQPPMTGHSMPSALPASGLNDRELLAAYQESDAEPGDARYDQIVAEIERRNLDI